MVLRVWKIGLLLALCSCCSCIGERKITNQTFNIPLPLEKGDIVVRKGRGMLSKMVLYADKEAQYSHIGMVTEVDHALVVIHSVPDEGAFDGIKQESIADYFCPKKALSGAIFRLSLSEDEQATLNKYAVQKLTQSMSFDHEYDLTDTHAQYCTEFVWNSFLQIGIDLSESRRTTVSLLPQFNRCLTPSDLYLYSKLTCIFEW